MGFEKRANTDQVTSSMLLKQYWHQYWRRLLPRGHAMELPKRVDGKRWRAMGDTSKTSPMYMRRP
jgi:hypothetical protein